MWCCPPSIQSPPAALRTCAGAAVLDQIPSSCKTRACVREQSGPQKMRCDLQVHFNDHRSEPGQRPTACEFRQVFRALRSIARGAVCFRRCRCLCRRWCIHMLAMSICEQRSSDLREQPHSLRVKVWFGGPVPAGDFFHPLPQVADELGPLKSFGRRRRPRAQGHT